MARRSRLSGPLVFNVDERYPEQGARAKGLTDRWARGCELRAQARLYAKYARDYDEAGETANAAIAREAEAETRQELAEL